MNEKNGTGESKSKQSQRQRESAPELLVGHAYAVEPLAVDKVLTKRRHEKSISYAVSWIKTAFSMVENRSNV